MSIKRGEIYLAAFDSVVGREIPKTRPVVVVSNDINNEFSCTLAVLHITSKNLSKIYPFEVFLTQGRGNLTKDSKIKADQIRTFDKTRLVEQIGKLEQKKIGEIENAIEVHLDLS
jgi:mRNA interferase MazF